MKDVLIVDDSALARMIMRRSLGAAGLTAADIREVPDGLAALAAVRVKIPDLVIADVNMPNLDGEGLLMSLRADASLAGVRVLMCSSAMSPAKAERLLRLGAGAVLKKPFSPHELRSALAGVLAVA
jgi:CheY-like chemotaxis protein